jgi:hypothetical protein
MAHAFRYKPRFKDIRVRPPKPDGDEREPDVHTLKPGERPCEHPECRLAATARAPKSRDLPGEHYHFCQAHAAEYNRHWDFWSGLTEAEIRRRQVEEQSTGGRPTWSFKGGRVKREAESAAARGLFGDPFGMFGQAKYKAEDDRRANERHLGKMERNALADLDLDAAADAAAIRSRYKDLVKRNHPDANGGDRSTEHKLQRVIKAYKTLQKSGLA